MTTDGMELRPFKTISRRTILDHGPYLTVESHTVQWPDGQVIADWPWIVSPDASIILAVNSDGRFLMFSADEIRGRGNDSGACSGYG